MLINCNITQYCGARVYVTTFCPTYGFDRGAGWFLTAIDKVVESPTNDTGITFLGVSYLAGFVNVFVSETDIGDRCQFFSIGRITCPANFAPILSIIIFIGEWRDRGRGRAFDLPLKLFGRDIGYTNRLLGLMLRKARVVGCVCTTEKGGVRLFGIVSATPIKLLQQFATTPNSTSLNEISMARRRVTDCHATP